MKDKYYEQAVNCVKDYFLPTQAVPIRISLRCMLMSRCRAMQTGRNTALGEQAPRGCIPSCLRTAHRNVQSMIC